MSTLELGLVGFVGRREESAQVVHALAATGVSVRCLEQHDAALLARLSVVLVDCRWGISAAVAACADLRQSGFSRPILCVGAPSNEAVGVEAAVLDAGADDFILWPLTSERLERRVRALTRRESGSYAQPLQSAGILLDPTAGGLFVNGRPVHLTRTEWRILATLMRREGACISADELSATCTSGLPAPGDTRKIRVHVSHLTAKLKDAGRVIWNVPGRGYVFQPEADCRNTRGSVSRAKSG